MPVYEIVFSNTAPQALGSPHESQAYTYRIDAATADEAIGLAEIEFAQKHPQKTNNPYRPHVVTENVDAAQRIQQFDRTAPLNPDQ